MNTYPIKTAQFIVELIASDLLTCMSIHSMCTGVDFRINGTDSFGRVEVSVHHKWGTLCDRYWDKSDASAFCRHLGFAAGFPYKTDKFKIDTGPVYELNQHCTGDEKSLSDCPHEGWKVSTKSSACGTHKKDAKVYCYNTGKARCLLTLIQVIFTQSGLGKFVKRGININYEQQCHAITLNYVCTKFCIYLYTCRSGRIQSFSGVGKI